MYITKYASLVYANTVTQHKDPSLSNYCFSSVMWLSFISLTHVHIYFSHLQYFPCLVFFTYCETTAWFSAAPQWINKKTSVCVTLYIQYNVHVHTKCTCKSQRTVCLKVYFRIFISSHFEHMQTTTVFAKMYLNVFAKMSTMFTCLCIRTMNFNL